MTTINPANKTDYNPANTKHLYSICTTSTQRLRRWPNIVQMLYKCFVFAGKWIIHTPTVRLSAYSATTARPAQRKALHMAHGSTTRNMLKYDPSKIAMCDIIDQKSIAFMLVESKMSYTAARNNLLMDMMEGRFSSRWDILTTSKRIMCIIIAL